MDEQKEEQNLMPEKAEMEGKTSGADIPAGEQSITEQYTEETVKPSAEQPPIEEIIKLSLEKQSEKEASSPQAVSGYTGEYGNRVEGSYQDPEQSTYRFSYKDGGGKSTHSGDYYAAKEKPKENQENPKNLGKPEAFQSWERNFAENQNDSAMPKGKKEASFVKKLAITAVCAVVFGVIASACFIGINYVSGTNMESRKEDMADGTEELKRTTEAGNNEAEKPVYERALPSQAGTMDVSSIVEQMMPAVVAITSTTKGTPYYDLFGQYYAGQDTTSAGTGFIVGKNEKELFIATNNHVISGAKTISVQFCDEEICEAAEKGSDAANDLAVVAVKIADIKKSTIEKIRVADLGDSDKAKVGEMVVAIGNALGYGQSVTVGYISAKDREITEQSETGNGTNKIKALQTDAAINPGNSGGALINMQGQVIGINSAKIASSQVEGVGYAIPISVATPIIDDLMKREVLSDSEKGYLGISGTTVSEAATMYNVPLGVYVREVSKGGAAELAGIKENDIITAINNMQVTTMESLKEKVNSYRIGTEIEITFQRSSDGEYKEQKVKVKLQGQSSIDGLTDNSSGKEKSGENGDSSPDAGEGGNYGRNGGGFGSLWDFFQ